MTMTVRERLLSPSNGRSVCPFPYIYIYMKLLAAFPLSSHHYNIFESSPLNSIIKMASSTVSKQFSTAMANDAALSSPVAAPEGPSKPIMPAIQTSSAHRNDFNDSKLCVHRGRAVISTGFFALPMGNFPINEMSDRVWRCCKCTGLGNPALSPERCSLCQHYKCPYCTDA